MSNEQKLQEMVQRGRTAEELENMQHATMSRRKLLTTLGVAGAAMAAGSIGAFSFPKMAEAAPPVDFAGVQAEFDSIAINVKWHGALGNGTADDAAVIQAAINLAAGSGTNTGGGTVFFPEGVYLVGTKLTVPSNVTLQGVGAQTKQGVANNIVAGSSIIREHETLGKNPIFEIKGTSGTRLTNIKFRDLTIRNGTAPDALPYPTADSRGKDGIILHYVDGFSMERCTLTDIEGQDSLTIKSCSNIYVNNCLFYKVAYSGMIVGPDSENIKLLNSTFDTVTSGILNAGSYNSYTFATGNDAVPGTRWPKNIWIENNRFLNNPNWEGIDSHGSENIWILNNYVENCRFGILVACDNNYVAEPRTSNVVISGNIVIKGSVEAEGYGITVQGQNGYSTKGVMISNNFVDGFGYKSASDNGAINIKNVKKFTITDNIVDRFYQNAILLFAGCTQGTITNNEFRNCSGGVALTSTTCIRIHNNGAFGIVVENNVVNPSNLNEIPSYFVSNYSTQNSSVQIHRNTVHNIGIALYRHPQNMNVGWDLDDNPNGPEGSTTAGINQKFGDVIYDTNGRPVWYVATPTVGYGSTYTGAVLPGTATAAITSGSRIMTVSDPNSTRNFPEGMNIRIPGAGPGGADLVARVIHNESTTYSASNNLVELNVAASTTVSNANVYYVPLTFVPAWVDTVTP